MANRVAVVGVAVVGLAIFLLLGLYIVDASAQNSRHDITVTNESFEPGDGTLHRFDNSELARADYEDSVTVRNESDGAVIPESGNYTWFESNGTLETVANSELANASTATITYGYLGQTAKQTAVTNVFAELMGGIVPLAFVGFVALLLTAAAVLGRVA